ncbi:hypothetical protein [Streptomyces doebereineriae]|uniref:Uncharacterized protein n=1 Tax=Streptomyces doebereineriae TaxID=3075528 RepID=A0ABU2V769_9ACTN|nr:hypothetical protein [Streptomyces sp. DSM 41640]MDT0481376.1 hypothetical protein [Streptomyces sp. DSM 41640]
MLEHAGFWSNHLLGLCWPASGDVRPAPEWFGDDSADTDATSEILLDAQAWPAFRIPLDACHSAVVVYRNLVGDYGIDYLLAHPDGTGAEAVANRFDGDWSGLGLVWRDLKRIVVSPDLTAAGVHDPSERLLILLPVLNDAELPADAPAVVEAALTALGAPRHSAAHTAARLLDGRRRSAGHRVLTGSRLSGGSGDHFKCGRILVLEFDIRVCRAPECHQTTAATSRAVGL